MVGERDSNFQKVDTGGYDAVLDQISTGHPLYNQIMSYYNSMATNVQNHTKLPSFMSKSADSARPLSLNGMAASTRRFSPMKNNVVGSFSFSASESGVNCSVEGNQLVITAAEAPVSS